MKQIPDEYRLKFFLYYILLNGKEICVYGNIGKRKFRSDFRA